MSMECNWNDFGSDFEIVLTYFGKVFDKE